MEFFTLFSGDKVKIAPDTKIVPAKEFSELKKAGQIVRRAKKESLEFKKQIAKEAELTKESAAKEGFEEGLLSFNEKLLKLDAVLKNFEQELTKKILPVALKAAKKILGEELKLHPDRILDIVKQSLKPVLENHTVKIYVSKKDLNLMEQHKDRIKENLTQARIFTVQERPDIEPGGCVIETEAGIINAQLENQWRTLEKAFEKILKS